MKTEEITFTKDVENPAMYYGKLMNPMPMTKYIFKLPKPVLTIPLKVEIIVEEGYHAELTVIDEYRFSVVWEKLLGSVRGRLIAVVIPI